MKKSRKKTPSEVKKLERQIENIQGQIAIVDYVCAGTLQKRMKRCGKLNCRCTLNPDALHGPYYEWTRREKGRFVNSLVPASQAGQFARAIENYQKVLKLLAIWSEKSASVIMSKKDK
jgi:hypothetical protein